MNKEGILQELSSGQRMIYYILSYMTLVAIAYLFYKSLIISLIFGFLSIKLEPVYESYIMQRRKEELLLQFKDFLYIISSSISVSKSMETAIKESKEGLRMMYGDGIIVKEVERMIIAIDERKYSGEEALKDMAKRADIEEIWDFVDTYSICIVTGGNIKKAILSTISILTDKMNIKRDIKALISQKQFEGKVVSAMPIVILLILNTLSPDYLEPLYTTLEGRILMTIALCSFLGSSLWIFKILNWK